MGYGYEFLCFVPICLYLFICNTIFHYFLSLSLSWGKKPRHQDAEMSVKCCLQTRITYYQDSSNVPAHLLDQSCFMQIFLWIMNYYRSFHFTRWLVDLTYIFEVLYMSKTCKTVYWGILGINDWNLIIFMK